MRASLWPQFLQWLKTNYPGQEEKILSPLTMISVLGQKNHAMKKPLGVITEPKEIEELLDTRALRLHSKKNEVGAYNALKIYATFLKGISQEAAVPTQSSLEAESDKDNVYIVDFLSHKKYSHTKPVFCKYKELLINPCSWNAIFHALVQAIYKDYKEVFPVGKSLSSSTRIDIGTPENMIYPKEIADGIYLECNVNANGIVSKLRSLMDVCHIDYKNIEIRYCVREKGATRNLPQKNVLEPKWEPQYTEAITKILSEKYKYGFRLGSAIELMKIRNYAESIGLNLPLSDEDLEKEISAAGTLIEGKVYFFSQELLDDIRNIIDGIFQTGVTVIFLEAFMERQETWLEEHHIPSEIILKEVLRQSNPHIYFGQNIITLGTHITEYEAVVKEIQRVAGEDSIVCLEDLTAQLQYIPVDKISWSLSASDEFVRVSEGKYFRMRYFIRSDEDVENIIAFVSKECNNKGYVSIAEIPLDRIAEENYELPTTALYSAVYISILKGHYYLNGKILTADPNGVDMSTLLKAYCQNRSECSVTEMINRVEELSGSINKQQAIIALYDTMVRIDVDSFTSESNVSFDVDRIDGLLQEVIGDQFAPVRKISTFALFPPCGVSWNYYLLESYCYRFSKKFRLSVLNFNDKNAGIIVAVDFPLNYIEILIEAVAKANIKLTPEDIGAYLFDNGYTARRKYSFIPEIIEKAKIIREEK